MDDWKRDESQTSGPEDTSSAENDERSDGYPIPSDVEADSAALAGAPAPAWTGAVLPDLETLGIQTGLVLSEKQRQHVGLLKKMLETEDAPAPKTRQRRDAMTDVWPVLIRLGTAALLLVVVIINITRNAPALAHPQIGPEAGQALAWIDRLGQEDALLAAFDYQPGFAAEVESAAAPVFENIAVRGAHVFTVSTLPLGSLLAEQYFGSRDQAYVTHLGYLPGGALGMAQANLAINSAEKIKSQPQNQDNSSPAQARAYPDFPRIDSLRLVVVITENAQVGRDWIEQMRPQGREMPLIIVTSAQAVPILRSYLNTSKHTAGMTQVVGLVSGIEAGLPTGGQAQPTAAMDKGWNAYEMGVVTGALTILTALGAGWLSRQRMQRNGPLPKRSSRI